MRRLYIIMAYITLSATLVQDPTRSRLLWIRTSTYVNDFLSVFERLDRKIFQSSCAIILQNKGGGHGTRKSYVPTVLKSNTSIKKSHWILMYLSQ